MPGPTKKTKVKHLKLQEDNDTITDIGNGDTPSCEAFMRRIEGIDPGKKIDGRLKTNWNHALDLIMNGGGGDTGKYTVTIGGEEHAVFHASSGKKKRGFFNVTIFYYIVEGPPMNYAVIIAVGEHSNSETKPKYVITNHSFQSEGTFARRKIIDLNDKDEKSRR